MYRELALAADDPRHGTRNGYGNLGCRCAACREANRLQGITDRFRRYKVGLRPDDPRHGLPTTYTNWGCRCPSCKRARVGLASERGPRPAQEAVVDPQPDQASARERHILNVVAQAAVAAAAVRADLHRDRLKGIEDR